MNPSTHSLPLTLQQARKARRLSQLELSLRLGVSQRHVSFVESGRARPSRQLLLAWLQELEAPLVMRNEAMLQAGYAPVYSATALDAPALAEAGEALRQLLQTHDPMPAMVLDAEWNILQANRGAQWLMQTLLPWVAEQPAQGPLNMLELLVHPEGLTRPLLNLAEKGPAMLAQLREEAAVQPQLVPHLAALAALLEERLGGPPIPWGHSLTPAPLLVSRFASPFGPLSFFSMFSTFGTPQDITTASLRVEHLFAADEATRAVLAAQVR